MYSVTAQLLEIKSKKDVDEKGMNCMALLAQLNKLNDPTINQCFNLFSNLLLDDCANDKCDIDVKKYFNLLFPTVDYSSIHIDNKQKSENINLENPLTGLLIKDTDPKHPIVKKLSKESIDVLNKEKYIIKRGIHKGENIIPDKYIAKEPRRGELRFLSPIVTPIKKPDSIKPIEVTIEELLELVKPEIVTAPTPVILEASESKIIELITPEIIEPVKFEIVEPVKTVEPVKITKPSPISMASLINPQILELQRNKLKEVQKIKVIENFYTKKYEMSSKNLMTDNTSAIFYDTQKNVFTKINGEVSLLDTIITDLAAKYKVDKYNIKVISDTNITLDSLKNDTKFLDGPFIVQLNTNAYDAYVKNTETKTIEGYLYNSSQSITNVHHIGKYGSLFI
jgi:hypothetical protein